MNTRHLAIGALLTTVLALPTAALAQSTSIIGQLKMSITIGTGSCSVQDAAVTFPPEDNLSSSVHRSVTLSVTCTTGTAYEIGFAPGLSAQGNQRRMQNVDDANRYINYELHRSTSYNFELGETWGVNTLTSTGTNVAQLHMIYVRLPAQANVVPGTYEDTVTVTVRY